MSRSVEVNLYIGKKKLRITFAVIAATVIAAVALIAALVILPGRGVLTVSQCRKLLTDNRYIIHAGGYIEDDGKLYSYSNSREALANCYDQGNRISEFDLMITSDDQIVCAHDSDDGVTWAHNVKNAGTPNCPPSLEVFINAKYDDCLSTMSFEDLALFMKDHPDFYVVTDVKDDNEGVCRLMKSSHPELMNNFIIQIYHEDEYDRIRDLGFNNIIYTLYRAYQTELTVDSLKAFTDRAKLSGITFWTDFPTQYAESFEMLKGSGIPLFVHTVNEEDEMKKFIDMGITGLYTDVTDKEKQYY
jgi:glycerophosphoryl diester phosphodiesterase